MAETPKHPDVRVKLVGEDGNSMMIMSRVTAALRKAEVSQDEINVFVNEAMSGDRAHLLNTVRQWVEVY